MPGINKTVSAETPATIPLAGTELLRIVQMGNSVRTSVQDIANLVPAAPVNTKGDLYGFGTTAARIPVGANGDYALIPDSTQTLGVKWDGPFTRNNDLSDISDATKGSGRIGFNYSLSYVANTIGAWLKGLATSAGATFIGYIVSWTGGITRSLTSHLSEHVTVKDFGAKGDGVLLSDGSTTATSAAFSSASATFTAADVGKVFDFVGASGVSGNSFTTTIAAFIDAHHITLGANAPATVTNGIFCYGTNDTAALQAAMDSGLKDIKVPQGIYLATALTWRIRTKLFGSSERSCVLRQTGTASPFIAAETGNPTTPYVAGDITEGGHSIDRVGVYFQGQTGIQAANSMSNLLGFCRMRVLHRDSDIAYYAPTAGTIGIDLQTSGTGSTYLPRLDDVEVRSCDTGVRFGATVNDFTVIGCWMLNCRKSFVLQGNSVGYINGAIETAVNSAIGLYFIGAASNNVKWDNVRFEMTGTTPVRVSLDPTASASYGLCEDNAYPLLTGGGLDFQGTKPNGFRAFGWNAAAAEHILDTGNAAVRLPATVRPYTAAGTGNTSYKIIRSDGMEVGEITYTTAGDLLTVNSKNGGVVKLQVNGADVLIANAGIVNFANHTTQTTSPSSGGAGALPATPAGYVTLQVNGVVRRVAYY